MATEEAGAVDRWWAGSAAVAVPAGVVRAVAEVAVDDPLEAGEPVVAAVVGVCDGAVEDGGASFDGPAVGVPAGVASDAIEIGLDVEAALCEAELPLLAGSVEAAACAAGLAAANSSTAAAAAERAAD